MCSPAGANERDHHSNDMKAPWVSAACCQVREVARHHFEFAVGRVRLRRATMRHQGVFAFARRSPSYFICYKSAHPRVDIARAIRRRASGALLGVQPNLLPGVEVHLRNKTTLCEHTGDGALSSVFSVAAVTSSRESCRRGTAAATIAPVCGGGWRTGGSAGTRE